jgi:hypothetical protein
MVDGDPAPRTAGVPPAVPRNAGLPANQKQSGRDARSTTVALLETEN